MNTEEYLSAMDINKLKENIEQFNTLNLTTATDLEIEKAIINILAVDNKINSPTYFLTIQENQYFCRVRNHYDYLDDFIKTRKFNIENLLNNPKPKIGRLNIENEKCLYLSNNLGTAIKECNIQNGDIFTVAIFQPKIDLSIISTYIENKFGKNSQEDQEKANLINNFIKNCLLKSENGNTNVYRVTNIIAGILYKLFESDGLLYFSAKDNKNFNLLINEKSINKLEVKYVFNCKKEKNIIFGQFIEIQDNQIIPRDISDESKNEILKKIGCSISKVDFDNQ